ncbi:MAG: DUF2752 domain-containing protein [Proteobacteria bacterium]|nr:MAG: DUF2752 domain-containing protein [Pseudomonadota bacterium]
MDDYMLPCLNKKIFGFDCPGCGTQRALAFLADGEFTKAFNMFPAIYTTLLFFVVVALHFIDRSHKYTKLIIWLAIANAAITIIAYIYKITQITNF